MIALTAIKGFGKRMKNTLKIDKRYYLFKNGKTLKRKLNKDYMLLKNIIAFMEQKFYKIY